MDNLLRAHAVLKIISRCLPIFVLPVLIQAAPLHAVEVEPSTMRRVHDPVQIPGGLLEALHSAPLESIRLYSHRDGGMQQMVYQVNERLEDGSYIYDTGLEANENLADKKLDPLDLVLIRVEDTGDRVSSDAWPAPEGVEIEIEDPLDGGRSYCYMIRLPDNAPPRLDDDTLRLEHWKPGEDDDLPYTISGVSYIIAGMVTKVRGRTYKSALNSSIRIPKAAGGSGINIIDGIRARVYIDLFFGQIRLDWDESGLIGGLEKIRLGEVQGYGQQWLSLALPLGIEGPHVKFDLFTYDCLVVAPLTLHVPFNPKHIITRAGIQFGYDFSEHAVGMRFYSPNCMEGVTVDGRMSEREKAMPDDWVSWWAVTGPQGSFIFRPYLDKALMAQTENRFLYLDDREARFPPEDEPGSMGYSRIGVDISSVKPGNYPFRFEWYFPPNFYRPEGLDKKTLQDFLNILDAPLVIRVGGREEINQSLNPPPLYANIR